MNGREMSMLRLQLRLNALISCALVLLACDSAAFADEPASKPARLRIGVAGLVHGHVYGFLQAAVYHPDVEIVGLYDARPDLLHRYGRHHHKLDPAILFSDLEEMLAKARPEAVAVFTDTFDHLQVVEACARRGVHVMVEKPFAVSTEHARAMERAATRAGIHLLVNYETTWYPSARAAWQIAKQDQRLGRVHRMILNFGHRGPKEIGMPDEFVAWLTDPDRNGGGALYDFGCYGANLATWLMDNRRPASVMAVTQRLKSDPTYRRVDDEATIVLTYPDAQVVIQASWNWPFNRKDMEIYGERGSLMIPDGGSYRLRLDGAGDSQAQAEPVPPPAHDPISYLVAVVRGRIVPSGPSSLETNVIAAEILDAARRSAETHQAIKVVE